MSVRVRPPVLSLTILSLLFAFLLPCQTLVANEIIVPASNGSILGVQFLAGEGLPYWSHRMQDPYLEKLQNDALLHALTTGNLQRTLLELNRTRKQVAEVRSRSGRMSFLASSGDWVAFGFSALGSFSRAYNLAPERAADYYSRLQRDNTDFLFAPGSDNYYAEILFTQKTRSLELLPSFMLSADIWIRPERWYVQPFLRMGISAPVEENSATGIFTSSSGLQISLTQSRAMGIILEGYADIYRVLWEDYSGFRKDALVWDTGWRAGVFVGF